MSAKHPLELWEFIDIDFMVAVDAVAWYLYQNQQQVVSDAQDLEDTIVSNDED